jgi:hypothetical protein
MIMERGIGDRNVLDKFAEEICEIIERHVKYIVVSGFVAISHGRRRTTEDIDMIIEKIPFSKFEKLHKDLIDGGFHCLQSTVVKEIYEYLENGNSIRYVRKNTFLPPEMKIKFVKDEIDELQIKTRKKLEFTGLDIWFSSIEMNIAFKEEYLGSDKDLEDARHLRIVYRDEIDEDEIEKIKRLIIQLRKRENGKKRPYD